MTEPTVSSNSEKRPFTPKIWIGYVIIGALLLLLAVAWIRGRSGGPEIAAPETAESAPSPFELCLTMLEAKAYQEALSLCKVAVDLAPGNLSARHNLGYAYRQAGQFDAAERELKAVLEADPLNARTLYELASTYLDAGRVEEARAKFEEVLEIQPDHGWARRRLEQLEP